MKTKRCHKKVTCFRYLCFFRLFQSTLPDGVSQSQKSQGIAVARVSLLSAARSTILYCLYVPDLVYQWLQIVALEKFEFHYSITNLEILINASKYQNELLLRWVKFASFDKRPVVIRKEIFDCSIAEFAS